MSLEFNGAFDHGLIVDSGYYDEEYDEPDEECFNCGMMVKKHQLREGYCTYCELKKEDEGDDEES